MKLFKKIIIILIVWNIIFGIIILISYADYDNSINKKLFVQIESSKIIEENIGEVKKIHKNIFDRFVVIQKDKAYIKYKITNDKNDIYIVKVYVRMEENKFIIYGYEINLKYFDETDD